MFKKKIGPSISLILLLLALSIIPLCSGMENSQKSMEDETLSQKPEYFNNELDVANTIGFVENVGQWNETIEYLVKADFGQIAFCKDHVIYKIRNQVQNNNNEKSNYSFIKVSFQNCNDVIPKCAEKLPGYINYFHGNNSSFWKSGVSHYNEVYYNNIWPGIDLKYKIYPDGIKYDIMVDPGSSLDVMSFKIEGHNRMHIENDILIIETENKGFINEGNLFSYYDDEEGGAIRSGFVLLNDNTYTFELENLDSSRRVVIDPLLYSKLLGGSQQDYCQDMVECDNGDIILTGFTDSMSFPTTDGAFQTLISSSSSMQNYEGFVMKIDSTATSIIFCTYIGGDETDYFRGVDIDDNGDIYVAGNSKSSNYPTTADSISSTNKGMDDIVVTKLNKTGSYLHYSTYIGGGGRDSSGGNDAIKVNSNNEAIVIGSTGSNDFPTTSDAYDRTFAGSRASDESRQGTSRASECVFFKISADGSSLDYSSFLGDGHEYGSSIEIEDNGNLVLIGSTASTSFPTTQNAYSKTLNGYSDAFIFKYNIDNNNLIFSTYFGGSDYEYPMDILLNENNDIYIIGNTQSSDFPTTDGAFNKVHNGYKDAFISLIDKSGSNLLNSTFLGGNSYDVGYEISSKINGDICITGYTCSNDFPITEVGKIPNNEVDRDAFYSCMDSCLKSLKYSTIIGGQGWDEGTSIIASKFGDVIMSGYSSSDDFPITDTQRPGMNDMFVLRFSDIDFPSEPQNIAADVGNGFINISWEAPLDDGGSDITKYQLYKKKQVEEFKLYSEIMKGTFFNDTTFKLGEEYSYKVRAFNLYPGPFSNEIVVTALAFPSPPINLIASFQDEEITLIWDPPQTDGGSQLLKFNIYRCLYGEDPILIHDQEATIFHYEDNDFTEGKIYVYWVSATNELGESPLSENSTISPKGVPCKPLNLSVEYGAGFVNISWSPPIYVGGADIEHYKVYRGFKVDGSVFWNFSITTNCFYFDDSLEIGRKYEVYITAVNSIGESPPCDSILLIPGGIPSSPTSPTISSGNNRITLTWSKPLVNGASEIINYSIYRKEEHSSFNLLNSVDFNNEITVFYLDDDVNNGNQYFYRITAINSFGESDPTSILIGIPSTVPEIPTDFIAIANEGHIILEWSSPTNDGGLPLNCYKIFRKTAEPDFESIASLSSGVINFTDFNISTGIEYYYYIKAYNDNGGSKASEIVIALPLGVPYPPSDLLIIEGDEFIYLSWKMPLNTGGLDLSATNIYKSMDNGVTFALISSETPNVLCFNDTQVQNGNSYLYSIRTENPLGESSALNSSTVTPGGPPEKPEIVYVKYLNDIVEIYWNSPENNGGFPIQYYKILRSTNNENFHSIGIVEGYLNSFTDSDIERGSNYHYVIQAINEKGDGKSSDECEIKIPDIKRTESSMWMIVMISLISIVIAIILLFIIMKKMKNGSNKSNQLLVSEYLGVPEYPSDYYDNNQPQSDQSDNSFE